MRAAINSLSGKYSGSFNIIEEFADLTPARKRALCSSLFSNTHDTFQATVRALWPDISAVDMNKLEKFLILIRKATH